MNCKSWIKKEAGNEGFGVLASLLKSMLTGECFTDSKNWLTLGETVPPGSARPRMSKQQNTETKIHG